VGQQQKALFAKIISELLKLAFDGEQAATVSRNSNKKA
jgi:hypothetical protein